MAVHSRSISSFRLLAVGAHGDLKLLEVEAERSASISLHRVCEYPADRLLQTVRDQDPGQYQQPAIMCIHRGLRLTVRNIITLQLVSVCVFSGVCELQSVCVLSFAAGRCCVLLNSDWLLQLQWRQTEAEPQTSSCCNIQLTDGDGRSAVSHCVCRDFLFVLSSSGLTCILDCHGSTRPLTEIIQIQQLFS